MRDTIQLFAWLLIAIWLITGVTVQIGVDGVMHTISVQVVK